MGSTARAVKRPRKGDESSSAPPRLARQVAIAAQKAGIPDLNDLTLQRFSVDRHPEAEPEG
jgi:hypothetical protein